MDQSKKTEMMEKVSRLVKSAFERENLIGPLVFLADKNGGFSVVMASLENSDCKDAFAQKLRRHLELRTEIEMLVFVSESWYERYDSLEEHPDRMEMAVFVCETRDGEAFSAMAEMKRDTGTQTLSDVKWERQQMSSGRFSNFFRVIGHRH